MVPLRSNMLREEIPFSGQRPLCQLEGTPLGRRRPKGTWLMSRWCLGPELNESTLYLGTGPGKQDAGWLSSLAPTIQSFTQDTKCTIIQCLCKNGLSPQKDGSVVHLERRDPRCWQPEPCKNPYSHTFCATEGHEAQIWKFNSDISARRTIWPSKKKTFSCSFVMWLPGCWYDPRESGYPVLTDMVFPFSLLRPQPGSV